MCLLYGVGCWRPETVLEDGLVAIPPAHGLRLLNQRLELASLVEVENPGSEPRQGEHRRDARRTRSLRLAHVLDFPDAFGDRYGGDRFFCQRRHRLLLGT